MIRQTDGQTDGGMNRQMDKQADIGKYMDCRMDGQKDRPTNGWIYTKRRMDRLSQKWTEESIDNQMNEHTCK